METPRSVAQTKRRKPIVTPEWAKSLLIVGVVVGAAIVWGVAAHDLRASRFFISLGALMIGVGVFVGFRAKI
jgi:high-affinity Fe2+/Pb2+ permease